MAVTGIHHASLLISDVQRSLEFYHDLLGIEVQHDRPDLGFPGAWLQVGGQQIHLLQLPNPDPRDSRPSHGGRDRHIALWVTDLATIAENLERAGIPYSSSRSGRQALFCRDPDQNALELVQQPS